MFSILKSILFMKSEIVKNERGASAIEYALIASLVAVAAITAVSSVGGKMTNVLTVSSTPSN